MKRPRTIKTVVIVTIGILAWCNIFSGEVKMKDDGLRGRFEPAQKLRKGDKFDELLQWLASVKPEMRSNFRFAYYHAVARFGMKNFREGDYWKDTCEKWMIADNVPKDVQKEMIDNLKKIRGFWAKDITNLSPSFPWGGGGSGGSGYQREMPEMKVLEWLLQNRDRAPLREAVKSLNKHPTPTRFPLAR